MIDFPTTDCVESVGSATYHLVRVSRRAMATTFEIAIPQGSHPRAIAAAEDALDLIDQLEDQLTVYRDHSEVLRLNSDAANSPVSLEPHLYELLERCAAWTRETEGAFDIATGALTKAWGFYHREGRVPLPRERNDAMARTGMKHVILNRETSSVKFRMPGHELNLGAVGKGFALDRAAELLRSRWGVRSALLHGGSSSVYALGHPPGEPRGWGVRLRHPSSGTGIPACVAVAQAGMPVPPDHSLGTLWLRDCGLGTSAATFQFFDYNGRKLGHLLDPRTGWPVEGTSSATVVAPSAAEADAMSTAMFVLGLANAERFLTPRPQLCAVMLADGTLRSFNLDSHSYTPD